MAYVLALVGCSNTCRFRSTGQEVAVSRLRWDSRPVRLRQRSCLTLRPAFIVVCIAGCCTSPLFSASAFYQIRNCRCRSHFPYFPRRGPGGCLRGIFAGRCLWVSAPQLALPSAANICLVIFIVATSSHTHRVVGQSGSKGINLLRPRDVSRLETSRKLTINCKGGLCSSKRGKSQ